jgi:hypothetical protein
MKIWTNIKLFVKNLHFIYISDKFTAHSFAGYGRHLLARIYARKRTVATGKRHYCFPYSSDIIMVCNRTELSRMKSKHIISKKANIAYMLENATFIAD